MEVIRREFSHPKNCFLTTIRNLNSTIRLFCLFYQAFFQAGNHFSLWVGILYNEHKSIKIFTQRMFELHYYRQPPPKLNDVQKRYLHSKIEGNFREVFCPCTQLEGRSNDSQTLETVHLEICELTTSWLRCQDRASEAKFNCKRNLLCAPCSSLCSPTALNYISYSAYSLSATGSELYWFSNASGIVLISFKRIIII